jgi:hypothetical protein
MPAATVREHGGRGESKGGKVSPPFGKGRLGGILQDDFKQLN